MILNECKRLAEVDIPIAVDMQRERNLSSAVNRVIATG